MGKEGRGEPGGGGPAEGGGRGGRGEGSEPWCKKSLRTSGGSSSAAPWLWRPFWALPLCPFWCGEAERRGEEEDGLRLERALLPLGPSSRCLGLSLRGTARSGGWLMCPLHPQPGTEVAPKLGLQHRLCRSTKRGGKLLLGFLPVYNFPSGLKPWCCVSNHLQAPLVLQHRPAPLPSFSKGPHPGDTPSGVLLPAGGFGVAVVGGERSAV